MESTRTFHQFSVINLAILIIKHGFSVFANQASASHELATWKICIFGQKEAVDTYLNSCDAAYDWHLSAVDGSYLWKESTHTWRESS
jgi:hypothetical protein